MRELALMTFVLLLEGIAVCLMCYGVAFDEQVFTAFAFVSAAIGWRISDSRVRYWRQRLAEAEEEIW